MAIVGCGAAAKDLHLPAYEAWNVDVAGVWDLLPSAVDGVRERFPFVRRVYGSLDELLADPEVAVVDIATRPAERPALILRGDRGGQARARPEAARARPRVGAPCRRGGRASTA